MRKAYNDYAIIIDDDGTFLGFSLGYDYCAEHEWGIKDMKNAFGMPESSKKNIGVKGRTITQTPLFVYKEETYKKQKCAVLYTGHEWMDKERLEKYLPDCFENYKSDIAWEIKYNKEHNREGKDPMISAWDSHTFGIAVLGNKETEYLKELKEAIEKKNIVIATINHRARNPFAGTALSIMIADRLPQEIKDSMYYADKKYYDLNDYEKKIGMVKIKEKARKDSQKRREKSQFGTYEDLHYYLACSPKWIDYDDKENREKVKKERGTKYDITYWINYADDDDICGHFTVEQIKKWLTGDKKLTEVVECEKTDGGRLFPKKR